MHHLLGGQVLGFQPQEPHELAQPLLCLQGQLRDAPKPEPGMHALMRQNGPRQQPREAKQHQDRRHLHHKGRGTPEVHRTVAQVVPSDARTSSSCCLQCDCICGLGTAVCCSVKASVAGAWRAVCYSMNASVIRACNGSVL